MTKDGTTGRGGSLRTDGAAVLRGGGWNAFATAWPQLQLVAISVAAARFLGPDLLGQQSFVSFVQLSLYLVFANGMPNALSRFTSQAIGSDNPGVIRVLLRWTWTVQLPAAAIGGGLLVAAAFSASENLQRAWLLAGVACAASIIHSVPASLLIGLQRWRALSLASVTTGTLATVATIAVLAAGYGIAGMFVVEVAATATNTIVAVLLAKRAMREVPSTPGAQARPNGRAVRSFAFMASIQAVVYFVVWRRSEFILLERYSTHSELALYSIAFATTAALLRIPVAFANVMGPAIANLLGADETERVRRGVARAGRLLMLISVPTAAGAATLAPAVVTLVYGSDYEGAGRVLVVMVASSPLVPIYYLSQAVLAATAKLWPVIMANVVAGVVDIGIGILVIPTHGAIGAAFANASAQLTATAIVIIAVHLAIGGLELSASPFLRIIGVGLITGAGALAAHRAVDSATAGSTADAIAIIVGVIAGGASALIGAMVLRPLTAADGEWLSAAIGTRVGPVPARVIELVEQH